MDFLRVLKEVFGKKKYLLMTFVIAFLFYSLNIIISSWMAFSEFSSDKGFFGLLKLFFFLFFRFGGLQNISSSISLVLISILFGILFSLILYKVRMNLSIETKTGFLGGAGIFLAALVPGCVACSVGLFSILGLGAGLLYSLPFKGLGISILSILILIFAIFEITKHFYTCKLSSSFRGDEDRIERR